MESNTRESNPTGPERAPLKLPVISWLAYNGLAVPLLIGGMHTARFFDEKARAGIEGRRHLWARLDARAQSLQGCVWFHASSAGEYEQARPMIRALREKLGPSVPTLLTVFSPSGHGHASNHPETDAIEYLPFDSFPAAERILAKLKPRALVFVRYDCWPNLVWSAKRRDVPLLLLGASLHERSQRLNGTARSFFEGVYRQIDAIGAIDESHAQRFRSAFQVPTERVRVTGDSRVDQVVARHEAAADAPIPKALAENGWRYLIVGSSWPADERVYLDAACSTVMAHDDWGMIIAPHEPTLAHLEALENTIAAKGLQAVRLSDLFDMRTGARRDGADDQGRQRVILVDGVGLLAALYRAGTVAYVGGGFTTGVHSVLEPAVCGLPVLFGPRHVNAVEAGLLIERGGGRAVETTQEFRDEFDGLIDDEPHRTRAGERARALVQEQAGATERNVDLLLRYVGKGDAQA